MCQCETPFLVQDYDEHCSDGILNEDETDIDCGGACAACDLSELCNANSDCASNYCDLDGS